MSIAERATSVHEAITNAVWSADRLCIQAFIEETHWRRREEIRLKLIAEFEELIQQEAITEIELVEAPIDFKQEKTVKNE